MAKKILVADDNPLIRKTLCRLFEAHEDYVLCAEAENGEEAVALSIKHRPDLVILDLEMPVMNGIDAGGRIKTVCRGCSYHSLYAICRHRDGKCVYEFASGPSRVKKRRSLAAGAYPLAAFGLTRDIHSVRHKIQAPQLSLLASSHHPRVR